MLKFVAIFSSHFSDKEEIQTDETLESPEVEEAVAEYGENLFNYLGTFINNVPRFWAILTYLVLICNVPFWGPIWTPPPLISDPF